MHIWTELEAGRGSNEISSCLWNFIEENYTRTQSPRQIIVWFDRCIGQNNNTIVLTTLMKLVRAGYFSAAQQKFFLTGHSFNICDRSFGVLEAKMRKTTLRTPTDVVDLILDSAQENPYTVQRMTQASILDFKELSVNVKFPSYFRVT